MSVTASSSITLTKADVDGTPSYDASWLTTNGWSTSNAIDFPNDRDQVAIFDGTNVPFKSQDGVTWTQLGITAPAAPALSAVAGGSPFADPDPFGGEAAQAPIVKSDREKIGRNEPCWCGSGKKFKNCHGARTPEAKT